MFKNALGIIFSKCNESMSASRQQTLISFKTRANLIASSENNKHINSNFI